jgi:DNA modification methylase
MENKLNTPHVNIVLGDSRNMDELHNESIDLIITSPPYWHIKDYGSQEQIGYGQSLHEYLEDLFRVWKECFRVLKPGSRLCINIGDQFMRSIIYGRYKIAPLHAEFITQCEKIGFDYMGSIIWQKKTTMNTTGGASIMGSYPFPPNGMIEIDYEFILIFKKPGQKITSSEIKEKSKLTKEEWKEYFSGHWIFRGERQDEHVAMFPLELPSRLIKMFSFVEDIVLDPFLGSGTTAKAAIQLGRNAIGYEINKDFLNIIKNKLPNPTLVNYELDVIEKNSLGKLEKVNEYSPSIQDAKPLIEPNKFNFKNNGSYKVKEILDEKTIILDSGLKVQFIGVNIPKDRVQVILDYLNKYVKNKEVNIKFDQGEQVKEPVLAYVTLKNGFVINKELGKLL